MKTTLLKIVPLAAAALLLAGCYHPKSLDSYKSAMEKTDPPSGQGDPGSFGGIADGSGGTQTATTYATSSKFSKDPMATTQDGKAARFAQPKDNEDGPAVTPTSEMTGVGTATRGSTGQAPAATNKPSTPPAATPTH